MKACLASCIPNARLFPSAMNPCVPLPCVASTDTDPAQPAADDPDIIDIPWLFTDSDIENADPPPGGWNLGDSYDIGTDEEESITKTTPLLKPIAPVLTTPAVAKHATVPLLPTTTLPASTSTVRAWASQTASSPMIPTARILAKVKQSPLRLRGVWRKHLSVSDIVSVAWCVPAKCGGHMVIDCKAGASSKLIIPSEGFDIYHWRSGLRRSRVGRARQSRQRSKWHKPTASAWIAARYAMSRLFLSCYVLN